MTTRQGHLGTRRAHEVGAQQKASIETRPSMPAQPKSAAQQSQEDMARASQAGLEQRLTGLQERSKSHTLVAHLALKMKGIARMRDHLNILTRPSMLRRQPTRAKHSKTMLFQMAQLLAGQG